MRFKHQISNCDEEVAMESTKLNISLIDQHILNLA